MTKNPTEFPVPPVDDLSLYDLGFTRFALPMTALAQEAGLFDRLVEQPSTIAATAEFFEVVPRAAEAMVAVMAALGFLQRLEDGRFAVSQVGRTYLVASSPFYRNMSVSIDDSTLELLRAAFRSGDEPVQPLAVQIEELEDIRGFIERMHSLTLPAASGLAQQEVFTRTASLLDVGGGSGSLSCGIAAQNPHIGCTILDLEPVCEIARENIAKYNLEDRVKTLAANMFHDPWPAGHDAILFGNIFHDWDADSCMLLAHRAFEMLEPGGSILLHEIPLNEDRDGSVVAACLSVAMLLFEKGKQYTRGEFEGMLKAAGFVEFRALPSFGYYHLISAVKP